MERVISHVPPIQEWLNIKSNIVKIFQKNYVRLRDYLHNNNIDGEDFDNNIIQIYNKQLSVYGNRIAEKLIKL